jgi:hypothetical protein
VDKDPVLAVEIQQQQQQQSIPILAVAQRPLDSDSVG